MTTARVKNPLVEFVEHYGPKAGPKGPERFVREILKADPDEWHIPFLEAYGRGDRAISVASCHGTGKTAGDAWIILHQMLTRFPQKTVATAPTTGQLEDALVTEVVKWFNRLPDSIQAAFEVKKNRIEFRGAPAESFFQAKTARAEAPEALQGVHCDPGFVLLVIDEASGVPEPIFEAGAGSMSQENATTIMTSNPIRASGFFFDSHHGSRAQWLRIGISGIKGTPGCYYSPRVSQQFIDMMAQTYGEQSNAYRTRVVGLFPKADDDTIIPYDLAVSAQERGLVVPAGLREAWAMDVARYGSDSTVLLRRNNLAVLPRIEKWHGLNLQQTYGRLKMRYDEARFLQPPEIILVDSIGYGAAIVDFGMADGLPIEGVNVSERLAVNERYHNQRAEVYFKAREWLETLTVSLPKCDGTCVDRLHCVHEALISEATALKYKFTTAGKILAESKDDYKARTKRGSPDIADAFAISFAADPALLAGSADSVSAFPRAPNWKEPVRRNRVRV